MDCERIFRPPPSESEGRIGFLGTFTSPAVEGAYRQRHFPQDRWLCCFLIVAGMLRVLLLLLVDYLDFGVGTDFWQLLAWRLCFLIVSACVLLALRRAASPAAAERLFLGWCFVLAVLTVYVISARPPGNTGLLCMSFVVVLVGYCVAPLPLSRQALLTLPYSVAILYVSREADSATLSMVALVHVLSNLFGAATSWRLNHWRREAFLRDRRDAELRARLQDALAEIRTLRGLLCICAWCKRIRDEAEQWQEVDTYVQRRTHAAFTHGICPDCQRSQLKQLAALPR